MLRVIILGLVIFGLGVVCGNAKLRKFVGFSN